jgi:hypothetical protein
MAKIIKFEEVSREKLEELRVLHTQSVILMRDNRVWSFEEIEALFKANASEDVTFEFFVPVDAETKERLKGVELELSSIPIPISYNFFFA